MKTFSFKKLDAFTSGLSSGNPAGYIKLSQVTAITESEMQQIAYELKGFVSEVGFVSPSITDGANFEFRYFSCEKEVPFCGHATVAICYDLAKENKQLQSMPFFYIHTKKGILQIENRLKQENLVFIQAPLPVYVECTVEPDALAAALNVAITDIDFSKPIEIINAGQNVLLVSLRSKEACMHCSPDYMTLRNYSLANNVEVINIYTSDTVLHGSDYRTRIFAPTFGYLEDPATGSGNAALGYYLANKGLWKTDTLSIEQGISRENPNSIVLRKRNNNEIAIGGRGVTRINGEYILM